jgi:hypothetical protein
MASSHLLNNQALSDDVERGTKLAPVGALLQNAVPQPDDDSSVGLSTCAKATIIVVSIVYVAICALLGFLQQFALVLNAFGSNCSDKVAATGQRLSIAGLVLILGGGVGVAIYCCVLPFRVRRKGGRFTRRHLLLLLPVLAQVASMMILLVLSFNQPDCGALSPT